MIEILSWIVKNRKKLFKVICAAAVGFLLLFSINTCNTNKKLSERLELALNNVEAYLGLLNNSLLANNVLMLTVDELRGSNDSVLKELDNVREQLEIKSKELKLAATQKQSYNVILGKGVGGDLTVILKDTTYNDSIKYNDLTTVRYTIGKDTVVIGLDVQNTQFLYVYAHKEYKNKKNFFLRLFTWDWKKTTKYKYEILNTNDILVSSDVRVIETKE